MGPQLSLSLCLLIGDNNSAMDMTGDTSTLVYHYTTRETALEKILFTNKLRLNPFICTNDPRESKLWNFTFMGKKPIQTGSSLALLKKTSSSDITDAVKYDCNLKCFYQVHR